MLHDSATVKRNVRRLRLVRSAIALTFVFLGVTLARHILAGPPTPGHSLVATGLMISAFVLAAWTLSWRVPR